MLATRSIRRHAWDIAIRWRVRRASAAPLPGRPSVVGFLRRASGLGQAARLSFAALERLGRRPGAIDISPWFGGTDLDYDPAEIDPGGGELIIQVNPPELMRTLAILGRRRTERRRLIGYWAWELPTFPAGWGDCRDFLHEVWVPSRYAAEALRPCGLPIRVVPHPVRPAVPSGGRALFGFDPQAFIVLTVFDLRSSFARKNPLAAIAAFRRGLAGYPNARLVLKIGNADEFPDRMSAIRRAADGDQRVTIFTNTLDEAAMAGLLVTSDVILSLHRAEGFGLVLAEAMALARPVIATAWSGNMDFMSPEATCLVPAELVPVDDPDGIYPTGAARWAEPSVDAAADYLSMLYRRQDWRAELGRRAQAAAARTFALDAWLEQTGMHASPAPHLQ